MKQIGQTLTKFLFYAVVVILIAWTASLTVSFISAALPNETWYVPYFALVIFDGGMLAWLFVFLKYAEGTIQRAVALGLTGFDFLGVALLVMAEILLGGQQITEAPEYLGTYAIWGIGVWTAVNVLGVLLFHIGDPEAQIAMSIQNEKDAILRGAMENLAARRSDNAQILAQQLGGRMYQQLEDELFIDRDGNGRPDLLENGRTGRVYDERAQTGPVWPAEDDNRPRPRYVTQDDITDWRDRTEVPNYQNGRPT